jgi:CHAT domain-containing protein
MKLFRKITSAFNKAVADTYLNLGLQKYDLGELQEALQYWERALNIYQAINDLNGQAHILNNLGELHFRNLGEFETAIEFYQQAASIYQTIGIYGGQAKALFNLGEVNTFVGQFEKAIEYYQEVLSIDEEIGYRQGVAQALGNIGNNYICLENASLGVDYLQQAINVARELGDRQIEANALGSLGSLYMSQRQYSLAKSYLQSTLTIAQVLNNQPMKDSVQELLQLSEEGLQAKIADDAFFQELGEGIKALHEVGEETNNNLLEFAKEYLPIRFFKQCQQSIQKSYSNLILPVNSIETIIDLWSNIFHLFQQGQGDEALSILENSLVKARQCKDTTMESNILYALNHVYLLLNQFDKCIEVSQQSYAMEVKEDSESLIRWLSLFNLAQAYWASGNLNQAETALREIMQAWECWGGWNTSGLQSDKANIDNFTLARLTMVYEMLQILLVQQDKIEDALEISERGRAKAIANLLAQRTQSTPTAFSTPSSTVVEIYNNITKNQKATFVEYSVIDERACGKTILLIYVIQPTGTITLRGVDIKSTLDSNLETLEALVKINHDAINNIYLTEPDIIEQNQYLQQLHKLLIEPIVDLLPENSNQPIIFIPQDELFLVPFSALQDANGKYLIETYTILIAPSIQVLELSQNRKKEQRSQTVEGHLFSALVVGNPKMPTIPLTEPPLTLRDLAWAKTEANAIAPLLNTQAITGADATKAYITQLLPKARLIHLATHGLLDDIRQLGIPGAIALAPSDGDHGFLTAGEIYDMKLNAELVVLSACSTGQGKITGDGVIGLSRCLIAAGVKSVIVSLWSVDDLSTALLMVQFYQIFQQGVAATVALNEAQRWLLGVTKTELEVWLKTNERFFDATLKINLRRRLHQLDDNAKLFQHPRYWAAFCAISK